MGLSCVEVLVPTSTQTQGVARGRRVMSDSNKSISPLRRRMIEDMTMRKLSVKTQSHYILAVVRLNRFLGRSPNTATAEDLRRFQLHLSETGVSNISINAALSGLKFLFEVTLDEPKVMKKMSRVYEARKLPVVLSQTEIAQIIDSASNPKYHAALAVAYATGLRSSEIVHLTMADIDSDRMLIHVNQGKGHKDRYALLSPALLEILRQWWRTAYAQGKISKSGWLFPGKKPDVPMTTRQLNRVCHQAVDKAGINKRVSLHTFRHSFATHLLEQRVDIRIIQVLLGHKKLNTTALYSQVATATLKEVTSPFDSLKLKPRAETKR